LILLANTAAGHFLPVIQIQKITEECHVTVRFPKVKVVAKKPPQRAAKKTAVPVQAAEKAADVVPVEAAEGEPAAEHKDDVEEEPAVENKDDAQGEPHDADKPPAVAEEETVAEVIVPTTEEATAPAAAPAPQDEIEAAADAPALVPPAENPNTVIRVTGTPENCERAIAAMLALVPQTESFVLDHRMHGYLIGKGGERSRALQAKTGVVLRIPSASAKTDAVQLVGLPGQLAAAQAAIRALLPEFEEMLKKNFRLEIKVAPTHHRQLIGPGGATVNKLREDYNVQLDFPRPRDKRKDVITIIGLEADAVRCSEEIKARTAKWESYVTQEVEIHPSIHRRIIGAKGAGIRKLQADHSVRVDFPKDNSKSPALKVTGAPEDVENAIEEMLLVEEEFVCDDGMMCPRSASHPLPLPPSPCLPQITQCHCCDFARFCV